MTSPRRLSRGSRTIDEQALPRSGDVLELTRAASVQFTQPIYFRVIRVHDWPTYRGWVWLDGYQLDTRGDAVARRSLFVQLSGLRKTSVPTAGQSRTTGATPSARSGRPRCRSGTPPLDPA